MGKKMDKKTILVVDDHQMIREGLIAILSFIPYLEVVGEAENGQVAIEKARSLSPDIILMDLSMPVMNGTEAISYIKQRNPDIKIIVLTTSKSYDHIQASLAAGASGYVLEG